jgi:8-oxo-dGTP pyrophosphatase MutT (NUDIX family)
MSDHYEPFLRQLRINLSHPLPGPDAQQRMAPRPRHRSSILNEPGQETRQGGVLVLLYPHADQVYFPLILRPTYSGVHSGQVGLPGGGYEELDDGMADTALRETYEEVGVHPSQITLLGTLTQLYVSASDYLVHPYIGWTDYRPEFRPDPYEVAKLIQAPLAEFLAFSNRQEEMWQLRGSDILVPFFDVQDQVIWGATAMILSEMLALPAVQELSNAVR